MKIPCTPGSKLLNTVRQKSEGTKGPDGGSTKFVEMGGTPVTLNFKQTEYLVGQPGCQFAVKCFIKDDQDCRISRGVYRITCKTCEVREGKKYVYIGTSGFSIHKCMLEHDYCAKSHSASNALGKHMTICHPNEPANFESEVLQGGIRYNLERFILEALEIEEAKNTPDLHVMNSRSEWGGKGLPRIQVTR